MIGKVRLLILREAPLPYKRIVYLIRIRVHPWGEETDFELGSVADSEVIDQDEWQI